MKYLQIYLMVALIFIFSLDTIAQDKEIRKKEVDHTGKITKEYDKKSGKTNLTLQLMPLACVMESCVFFNLKSSFDGEKLKVPSNRFIFGLFFFTKKLEPFSNSTLFLKANDVPIEVGAMTFAGKVSKDNLDVLTYGIPLYGEEIKKIASAKKVEVRIDELEFTLEKNEINAIKDFYEQATTVIK